MFTQYQLVSYCILGAVPCMVQLSGLCFIPESPRWLLKTVSEEAFEAALKRLRGEHTNISAETAEILVMFTRFLSYANSIYLNNL